jgi:hypothetical protein
MTLYRAAKLCKIPETALFKHVKGMRGVKSPTLGRPIVLPLPRREKITECLKLLEKWGFSLSKEISSGDDRPVCQ